MIRALKGFRPWTQFCFVPGPGTTTGELRAFYGSFYRAPLKGFLLEGSIRDL